MTLSPDQAAQSLQEIDQTGRRSASAYGYAHASPFFILWGLVWIVGYGGTGLLPPHLTSYLWAVADGAGILGSIWIGRRMASQGNATEKGLFRYRFLGVFFIVALFITGVMLVMGPTTGEQGGAFAALLVALLYGLVGLWQGLRFLITGAVIAVLTLAGFFYLHAHFFTWMAAVGGGALILAGLWLRKV